MRIHFFYNTPEIHCNLKRWNINECPILLIIGLSGSGKTTYAQKIALYYDVPAISFDVLKFFESSSKDSQDILSLFLDENVEICNLVNTYWRQTDLEYSNDVLYNYFCNAFFDFLIDYCKKNNKLLILEGIQLFVRIHPYKTCGMPLIALGTSSLHSNINKFKRDYMENGKSFCLIEYILQTYLYHIKQYFGLNKYLFYYNVLNNFFIKHHKR